MKSPEQEIMYKRQLEGHDVESLVELCNRLTHENQRLKSMTYCAYCGKEFPIDDDAGEVGEHIRTCDKHPMRELEKQNQRLRELLKEIWYWYQNDGPGVLTYWADDLEKELADD